MRAGAHSIRSRLLTGILATLVLILGGAGWRSYSVIKHESEELFSARLATSARVLDALVAQQVDHATIPKPLVIALPKEIEQTKDDTGTPLGHPYETKIAFQIWRDDGALLVRSASAPERQFSPNAPGFSTQRVDGTLYNVFVLRSGATWIQVAEKDEVREELLHDFGKAVMMPSVSGTILLLVLMNVLVVYGLSPLRQLAENIARRKPDALDALDEQAVPAEVAPVVRALNNLLERVHDALEHERHFTDAAAHELRTPLAALKIHADNAVRAATETERKQSMQRLHQGLERATKLAEQMLAYSRTRDASDHEERVSIGLAVLVREAIAQLEPLRLAKNQEIDFQVPADAERARIFGEPTKVHRLVVNLLDNASRYAPAGTVIDVEVRRQDAALVCGVANHGTPIPAELRERVFDPYYRIPGGNSDGSGLGLAIVKEIAEQHGASVELTTCTPTEGTLIRVRFPLEQVLPAARST